MSCAFCDETEYGGTVAFRGDGVVEQTTAYDVCINHWQRFWSDFTKAGWFPHDFDKMRTCVLREEDGTSIDVFEQTYEIEISTDDPWNGRWRLIAEDSKDIEVADGAYRMTLVERYET
jgi:hypothetical protein